jgi:hypothetical protein
MSSLIIPILFIYSKKCRHHPAEIISIICLFEAVASFHIYILATGTFDYLNTFDIPSIINIYSFGS